MGIWVQGLVADVGSDPLHASWALVWNCNGVMRRLQVRIVKHAFEIIHLLTDQNPIQVTVDAIINR